ncbi:MAG: tRNA ligase subunit PheS family protein, partial [Candidatus Kariarchaeaceae archaeon]
MSKQTLTPENLRILNTIYNHGPVLVPELTDNLNMDRGKVEGGIATLVELKLIHREKSTSLERTLTERGIQAKEKLAERQIINALRKDQIHMNDLAQASDLDKSNLTAGIGILKKANVIQITKGQVSILDEEAAESFSLDIQDALIKLAKNGSSKISSTLSTTLEARGFIELVETSVTTVYTEITRKKLDSIVSAMEVTKLTPQMLATGGWRDVSFKPYSLSTSPRKVYAGRFNPYRQFLDQLRIKLIGLGFQEMKGPLIEQEFWNFDALYAAQDHPSREDSDILLVKKPSFGKLNKASYVDYVRRAHEDGWKTGSRGFRYKWDPKKAARLLLRPQGTSISARTLSTIDKPPAKFFSIARCFRPDQIDATHDVEFDQTEGIICDPSITFRDLLGMLRTFAIEVAG